jgi:site-specific DNA-methyltransferase (adenine-specific)
MRIEEGENFKIFCGDARDVDPQEVDLLLSDPPYLLEQGGCTTEDGLHKRMGEDYKNDGRIVECDIEWQEIAAINYAWLRSGKHAYIMCNNRHVEGMLTAHSAEGFSFHNLLVWDKVSMTANRWYMKNCEYIGFFYKQSSFPINNCSSKQLVKMPQKDETKHPTEKPVLLMQHYIENSTQPGETVFDPFMGVATTGVAALKSGRKFIGIEIDEKWFDVAVKRLSEADKHKQEELF